MTLPSIRRYALALSLALAPFTASAQERVPVDMATTTQKATFVENLVTNSVAVRRIEESGDSAAKASLAEARRLVVAARQDLNQGAAAKADEKLGQALTLLNDETRRLSGDALKGERRREAYDRRLNTVRTFLSAYKRVAEEGGSRSAAKHAASIQTLMDKARGQAAGGGLDDAIATLDRAYVVARGDIRQMREGQTLVRTLDFATAEEAYDYEIGRNQSYFVLLQFALGDKKPTGSVVGRINELRAIAQKLRSRAEGKASAGDHPEAIDMLNESTEQLLSAIRMSGVFIPG